MTKPLSPVPAKDFPVTHMLVRALFFGAVQRFLGTLASVVLVGGTILGFLGWRVDQLFMSWLHL